MAHPALRVKPIKRKNQNQEPLDCYILQINP